MKPVDKAVNNTLALSLFFTIGFVLGIPCVILGAIYHIWVVMGIGIAFCLAGFYGMPLTWTAYGNRRSLRRIVYAIVEECIYTVPELAEHLSIRGAFNNLFQKAVFTGLSSQRRPHCAQ